MISFKTRNNYMDGQAMGKIQKIITGFSTAVHAGQVSNLPIPIFTLINHENPRDPGLFI